MISVRVVVLDAIFITAGIIYTALPPHVFSSSTSRGLDFGRAFSILGDSYADVGSIPGGPAFVSPSSTWMTFSDQSCHLDTTEKMFIKFVEGVVGLVEESLRRTLYGLGWRNMMVNTLAPLNCLPASTVLTNFTTCASNETVDALVLLHNLYLETTLATLSKDLPGINFVPLRKGGALAQIQKNMALYNISEPIRPCCLGYVGGVDRTGNLLYTLCENPESYVVRDGVHLTWENVVNIYLNLETDTTFVPTLRHWIQNLP